MNEVFSKTEDAVRQAVDGVSDLARAASESKALRDAKAYLAANPLHAVLAALAVGFLVGRLVSGRHDD